MVFYMALSVAAGFLIGGIFAFMLVKSAAKMIWRN